MSQGVHKRATILSFNLVSLKGNEKKEVAMDDYIEELLLQHEAEADWLEMPEDAEEM